MISLEQLKTRMSRGGKPVTVIAATLAMVLVTTAAWADEHCGCDETICSTQGFEIRLAEFSIDQLNGQSVWTYEICNPTDRAACDCDDALKVGPEHNRTCPNLSHIDIDLPGLGGCLSPTQSITFAQVSGAANAELSCGVSEKDPSCGIDGEAGTDFVAKCDVTEGNDLDPGECVTMVLTIAGETPGLGRGAASTVTKAGPACGSDAICGPACGCGEELADGCLTRSPGFWGTHPDVSQQFLPITVCGQVLTTTDAGSCSSVSEALCVSPGLEANRTLDRNPAYAQLVRQLAAAKLNIAASAANGGNCENLLAAARIAQCEALCGANKTKINKSGCLEDLDAFNNSLDTVAITPPPFDAPGRADPSACQESNGNGIIIGKKCN